MLVAAACWGMSGVFVKMVSSSCEISAIALAFWRDTVTFVIFLAYGFITAPRKLMLEKQYLPGMIGMGISLGLFHTFYNLGILINGVAVTTIQQASMPAIVSVVAWYFWKEHLGRGKICAIFLTFAGTVLTVDFSSFGGTGREWHSLIPGLSVPVFYAAWNLFGKKNRGHYDTHIVLTFAFGFAALMLLFVQPFTTQPFPLKPDTLLWFAGLIGVSTVIAFLLYTFGLGRIPASMATILAMSEIVFAGACGYFFLGEAMSLLQLSGSALVIIGVLYLFRTG
ncbi:hypothetical protein DENIS_2364 [Desulfonema ishimotonii]|uniref:EamA domain-containing protein n=1 Tax=Desulfonema ishimotonii TaxID=45657 RepID=A0A401FWU7_9BACT|nr:hypothetical protein DENIS_2364 [Desulfonema ishimotonii]